MNTLKVSASALPPNLDSVPTLLERAVIEMRGLTSVVNELEALIGNLAIAGSFSSSKSIYDLQKLDSLRQNIGGIADFLDGIGRGAAPEWTVDANNACELVTLADLSERLRGNVECSTTKGGENSGYFELFGDDELSNVA